MQHIDAAEIYGSEEGLGKGLQDLYKAKTVKREDLFITSKLWDEHHAYDAVLPAVQGSLANLQTDYLDLYLIHWCVLSMLDPYVYMRNYIAGKQLLALLCKFCHKHPFSGIFCHKHPFSGILHNRDSPSAMDTSQRLHCAAVAWILCRNRRVAFKYMRPLVIGTCPSSPSSKSDYNLTTTKCGFIVMPFSRDTCPAYPKSESVLFYQCLYSRIYHYH